MLNLMKPVRGANQNRNNKALAPFNNEDELNVSQQSPTSLLLQTNTNINMLGSTIDQSFSVTAREECSIITLADGKDNRQ